MAFYCLITSTKDKRQSLFCSGKSQKLFLLSTKNESKWKKFKLTKNRWCFLTLSLSFFFVLSLSISLSLSLSFSLYLSLSLSLSISFFRFFLSLYISFLNFIPLSCYRVSWFLLRRNHLLAFWHDTNWGENFLKIFKKIENSSKSRMLTGMNTCKVKNRCFCVGSKKPFF